MEETELIGSESTDSGEQSNGVLVWLLLTAIAVMIVVILNVFFCRLVTVSGDSMYPTLQDQDLLLVRLNGDLPEPGEIVVCEADESGVLAGKKVVKRCIATAGQTIFIDYANNTISVDGVVLDEPYINLDEEDPLESGGKENTFYIVPEGYIFVLGDNRNHSSDSRDSAVGLVPVEDVLGGMLIHIPLGAWLQELKE